MVRKKTIKRGRKGDKKGGLLLLLAVLTFIMALGFFFASRQAPKSEPKSPSEIVNSIVPSVKKAVTGSEDINLKQKSLDNQRTIDDILMQQKKWQLSDDGRRDMSEERTDAAGKIAWLQRKLLIGIPYDNSLKKAANWVTEQVEAQGFKVVEQNVITYIDDNAIALSIAMVETVGKNEKNLVFEEVIIFNGDQTNEKSKEIAKEEKQKEKALGKKYSGKMAVVVDDCGYDLGPVRSLCRVGGNFAFAILPFKGNSKAALDIIKSNGNIAMLHLPMEPLSGTSSENKFIRVGMTSSEIQKVTQEAVNSLPGIAGMNNHQGSKATADYNTMKAVMGVMKKEGLFYVDSRTNASSLGEKVAGQLGIRTGRNNRFLDNSSSVSDIKDAIWSAAKTANTYGSIIVICHARPATAQAWTECIKDVKAAGITFVPVTDLLI